MSARHPLAAEMVRSYAELAAINHLGGTQLPSKAAVAAVRELEHYYPPSLFIPHNFFFCSFR